MAFCVRHLPTLWTAGEPRRAPGSATRWIVPIVLCYPDGYEGTLGEMAWDEQHQEFTLTTDKAVLAERARMVASSRPAHGTNAASPEAGASCVVPIASQPGSSRSMIRSCPRSSPRPSDASRPRSGICGRRASSCQHGNSTDGQRRGLNGPKPPRRHSDVDAGFVQSDSGVPAGSL